MSADAPDDGTGSEVDDTQVIEAVDDGEPHPLIRNNILPPPWGRRVIHSWPFYIVVMWVWPAGLWALCIRSDWNHVLKVVAIVATVLIGITTLMRYRRGSVLEREARRFKERHDRALREVYRPYGAVEEITVSNRIGDRLIADELVEWEFRLHPINLITRFLRRIFGTKVGVRSLLVYVAGMVLWLGMDMLAKWNLSPWWGVGFALLPTPYFVYAYTQWYYDRFALTNSRYIAEIGLATSQFGAIPRNSILDQNDVITGFSRLLSWSGLTDAPFGILQFETAGGIRGNLPERTVYVPNLKHMVTMLQPRPIRRS